MKVKGSDHARKARILRETADKVEQWEAGESGLDEAELMARIQHLDADTAWPEPLTAALGALSGGLRAGYAAMHEPTPEDADGDEGV